MKIAIVDDETEEQEILAKYIREWARANKELVEFSCFTSSEAFLFAWEDDKDYALLVLDIEMGGISGLELAKKIRLVDQGIPILFVTGYDEYMQYGYDVAALHYLIKPVQKEKLFQVLNKLGEQKETEMCLVVNAGNEVRRLPFTTVFYVDATAIVPQDVPFSGIDLSVLIGNLLDNAMEACAQVINKDERFIRIYIDIVKKQLYISVTNSMDGRARRKGLQYLSTKAGLHGFGLIRIDRIASKYGGFINRQNEEGVFATEVMLPLIS